MNNNINKFTRLKGAKRMIQNLVFSAIREFNSHSIKFSALRPIFNKLILTGSKSLELFLAEKPMDQFSIDASLMLGKDFITKEFITGNTPIQEIAISNSINKYFENNDPQKLLEEIANNLTSYFNSQIDSNQLTKPSSNMIYVVQLDAIMQLIYPQICQKAYTTSKPCYSCFVIHKVNKVYSQTNRRFIWTINFKLNLSVAQSFMGPIPNLVKEVDFFEIHIADGFLQFQNYLNRFSIEISPQLPVILPTLVLNYKMDLDCLTDEKKKATELEKFEEFITLPLTKYSCTVVGLLYPNFDIQNFELKRRQYKNIPVALDKLERNTYEKLFLQDSFSKMEMENYVGKETTATNPLIIQEYEKKFIKKKLKNIGLISNLNKVVIKNSTKNQKVYDEKLSDARDLCKKYFGTSVLLKNFKNNSNKGVKTGYVEDNKDNYYSRLVYGMFREQFLNLLVLQQNDNRIDGHIIKFTSFGYMRFLTENYTMPNPELLISGLDDLDEGAVYFLSMPLEDMGDYRVSRNFMDQNGFLLIIKTQKIRNNVRMVESSEKNKINFYNYKIRLEKRFPSYQKIELEDGSVYLDQINILLFSEIEGI